MAAIGGRTPYDQSGALTGPARVVYAPLTVATPTDLWDIVAAENTAGEYPLKAGWVDFGLAADAPSYTHSRETEGIEYQQPSGPLFETISAVNRAFTAQVGEISATNLAIVENVAQNKVGAVAAGPNKSAQSRVPFGLYSDLISYRVALISYRPSGAGVVIESNGTERPPAVALVLPVCRLGSEDSEISFESGTPVNTPITFSVFRDTSRAAGEEHGFWITETAGTITAV